MRRRCLLASVANDALTRSTLRVFTVRRKRLEASFQFIRVLCIRPLKGYADFQFLQCTRSFYDVSRHLCRLDANQHLIAASVTLFSQSLLPVVSRLPPPGTVHPTLSALCCSPSFCSLRGQSGLSHPRNSFFTYPRFSQSVLYNFV
ncbi:hypothetical protein L798_12838 [Zootermopsis nevadensis]|uniref:Uncharacterized protein n=1 Tax=Zootermopsis nevadensis TaxID=136037 RepID=A0A067RG24_ZOONE|nr:hypothetical protein L798_12838 [Zootermopsis nevadensis]